MESSWLSVLRTVLELLSFISGPILAIVAIYALKQISIAKGDVQIRSKREAATLAASQCQRYSDEIIPWVDKLNELISEKEIPEYKGVVEDFIQDDLLKDPLWLDKWIEKTNGIEKETLRVLNGLESYAIYFTTGVADEEIAFSVQGITYCHTVKDFYPFIAITRSKDKQKHYDHIVNLYKLWNSKLEKFNLEEQINTMQSKIKSIKVQPIKPLGTDF